MTQAPSAQQEAPGERRLAAVASNPTLYLVYLVFFFVPMLFQPLGPWDVGAAALAIAVFIPLHYLGFNAPPLLRIATIAGFMVLATATAPFINGNSVFFVYAAASAGFLRPVRLSTLVFVIAAIVYLAGAWAFERHPFEISVAMLIAIIVWVSCFSTSEGIYESERAERARALDLQQASLIERERIARDLHDLLGHTLTLVSLKADLVERLVESDPQRARRELQSLQSSSREALADIRATLSGLTVTTVEAELKNAISALDTAGISLQIRGDVPQLNAPQDAAFGLMLREAITNVIRHSSASAVEIRFAREDGVYSLAVSDNGEAAAVQEGNGLNGLRRRLEQVGGMLTVRQRDGVHLRAMVPE